ncbi:type VII secretion target [Nocardia sp. CA-135953]|uniref:type VII secretion target n=1 Tax=Nocardia sp. CA-135953 TaxID=3239978 RepID=UPI003D9566FD
MPEYLIVDPEELRRIAEQHELAAADIRKWGEIPHAWLDEFPNTYGTIADPMHGALVDYYNKRHDKAERAAVNHEQARDQLLAAARALEGGDQVGAHQINQSSGNSHATSPGDSTPTPSVSTDPAAPVHTGPDTPIVDGPQPQPSVTTPDGTLHTDQTSVSPAASAPQTSDGLPAGAPSPTGAALPAGAVVPIGTSPSPGGVPDYNAADMPAAAARDSGASGGSSVIGEMPAPLAAGPAMTPVYPAEAAARVPAPLGAGPFAAAAHTAEDRRALPSFVVGEQADDDLVLARTLLAAVLAAVRDSALGLEWAVGVARTPAGPIVVLTSTEGRGWLPPGLFLPSEIILPWRWDGILGGAGREAIAALEGTTDPARMLAESGSMMVGRSSIRLSALVSSAAIPDRVRAALGDHVAIDEWVSAAESAVDLTTPGVGLVDRLTLAGSVELLEKAATVPETEIWANCLELARAADAQVRTALPGIDGESGARRARRQRILDALLAGEPVPASWWDQVRAADDMAAATLRSRRVDVSHVPVGGVRLDGSVAEALRGMVFERRADELLLLLAAAGLDRQTLRDALYTYGQITEHPQFPATARTAVTQVMATSSTLRVVPNVEVGRGVGPDTHAVSASRFDGAPPSIAEMRRSPAKSESLSEQRRS